MSSPARYSPRDDLRKRSRIRQQPETIESCSPARQLAEEFSKIFLSDSQAFKRSLDEHIDDKERSHKDALVKSLAEHEAIRDSAEKARQRVEAEIERERRRREDEERIRLEEIKLKSEREENERRQKAAEIERQADEQKLLQERLEAQKREDAKKKEEVQRLELQRQSERRKAEEQSNDAERLLQQQQQQPVVLPDKPAESSTNISKTLSVLTPHGISTSAAQRESEHKRYLQLHKNLKEMRKWVLEEAGKHSLKNKVGDMRRVIQKSLSIVNAVDRSKNFMPTRDIKTVLEEASKMSQITISPKQFIVSLDNDSTDGQYSAILLFLLSYFAKYILHRYTEQVSRDPKAAEPYGVLVAQMFSNPELQYNGHSLIDVLWAKYHKTSPVLFGIGGDDKTANGRMRLGWKYEKEEDTSSSFVSVEEHLGNQAGLAAGFASITLRNFAKSRNQNPAPNRLYWTSLSRVLSTPIAERTATHYVIIRSMIEHSFPRFIEFYGTAALAAMRAVFKDWPSQAVNKMDPNVLALESMVRFFEKDHNLYL